MNEKLVTLKDLEDITGIHFNTIRTWLSSYRFTKFRRRVKIDKRVKEVYCLNKEFLETMSEYLWLKRRLGAIKCLEKYYKKEVRGKHD